MPSLHFATSFLAAMLLAENGPARGRARLCLRGDARVRARLPGRALRDRPDRRGRPRVPREAGRASGRAARPADQRGASAPGARSPTADPPASIRGGWGATPRWSIRTSSRTRTRTRTSSRTRTRTRSLRSSRTPSGSLQTLVVVLLLVGAIYVLLPKARRHPGGGREAGRCHPDLGRGGGGVRRAHVLLVRGAVPGRRRRARPAPGMARVLPDHDGRAGGHAAVLGGRGRRHRADLLGAPQGRDAAAPDRLPDGGLPGPAVRRLHGGAGGLRRALAHRGAQRAKARSA